jgi:hypothetical protein
MWTRKRTEVVGLSYENYPAHTALLPLCGAGTATCSVYTNQANSTELIIPGSAPERGLLTFHRS